MMPRSEIPADAPTIVVTRVYDAPRALVWQASTDPRHVRQWWGGPGVANPKCEMDLRVGGRWEQLMRLADGRELRLDFVFLEIEPPERLVWRHADRQDGGPTPSFTLTLDELGDRTRYTLVVRFDSIEQRNAAVGYGFTGPIEASHDRLVDHLKSM